MSSSTGGEAESHRIYWQQWLSTTTYNTSTAVMVNPAAAANLPGPGGGISTSAATSPPTSPFRQQQQSQRRRQRQLTTSSAAVRIAPQVAKAIDVTSLLRRTLNFAGSSNANNDESLLQDALVLVGTLSVPHDYVSFEHEPQTVEEGFESMIPFHLVKTLQADDNPLAVRDDMMKQLEGRQSRLFDHYGALNCGAPSIQWFFVPGVGAPSIIPNCVELEGFATMMVDGEEETSDEEEDNIGADEECDEPAEDTNDKAVLPNSKDMEINLVALPEGLVRASLLESSLLFSPSQHKVGPSRAQRRQSREWRRYLQVSQSHNANPNCLAGYLLKRSIKDKHVWRKVYCLLTEDYMWYIHRMTPWCERQPIERVKTHSTNMEETIAMAPKHGRIALSQALLLEVNEEFERSPLHRVPHAFQIVDGRGVTHSFRASSKSLLQQWIQSLSTRLIDSYDNSFLENAELIVAEESLARNQRYKSIAVDALRLNDRTLARASSQGSFASHHEHQAHEEEKQIECLLNNMQIDLYTLASEGETNNKVNFSAQVVRLGINVAEYRESCRHIQVSLLSQIGFLSDQEEKEPNLPVLTVAIQKMVQDLWHDASRLLGQATQIASLVQIDSGYGSVSKRHASRSLDTLCHHIEFVITGQIRRRAALPNESATTSSNAATATTQHPDDPPPIDLFDRLLTELQQATAF